MGVYPKGDEQLDNITSYKVFWNGNSMQILNKVYELNSVALKIEWHHNLTREKHGLKIKSGQNCICVAIRVINYLFLFPISSALFYFYLLNVAIFNGSD